MCRSVLEKGVRGETSSTQKPRLTRRPMPLPGAGVGTGAANDGARPFSQLVIARVTGWRVLWPDFATHEAHCLLETRTSAYTAWLGFDCEGRSIRVRVRLPHGVERSAALERVLARTVSARLQPDSGHKAEFVLAGYPFFDGSPAQATMDFAVGDLRCLLDSPECAEAIRLGQAADSTRRAGGAQ